MWFLISYRHLRWPAWYTLCVILLPPLQFIKLTVFLSHNSIIHDLIPAILQCTWSHNVWIANICVISGWLLCWGHNTTFVESLHHLRHMVLQVLKGCTLAHHDVVLGARCILVLLVGEIKHCLYLYKWTTSMID